jgi:hypothetical protein
MTRPALSLILCSRNDQYMGNSLWRLQTSLEFVAKNVHEMARDEDVEVVVADWGSEVQLRDALDLSPLAARIVSFIHIEPALAQALQKDSPFAEVFALNAAARRTEGEYIGRIDQDTLVGKRFLEYFFDLYEGRKKIEVPLNSALLFANQRMIPYRICVKCPPFWVMDKYIRSSGRSCKIEYTPGTTFYKNGVGIWLINRELWNACGGYDEQMIYMNAMEINMISRLKLMGFEVIDLGKLVDYDFYHMEHYHSLAVRSSSTHRKVNPDALFQNPKTISPNGPDWGLKQIPIERMAYSSERKLANPHHPQKMPIQPIYFTSLLAVTRTQIVVDEFIKSIRMGKLIFMHRYSVIREAVSGQPVQTWPRHIMELWAERKRNLNNRVN